MSLQISSLGEWFVAMFTFVSLFFCVQEQVGLQTPSLTKWFITLVTFVQLLFRVIMCIFKYTAWLNDLLHPVQLCIFTPLWVSMCFIRFPVWLNDLLQLNFFSPLWINRCVFRFPFWLNDLSHKRASSLHCELKSAFSDLQPGWMICCTVHICATSFRCVWANVCPDCWKMWKPWRKCCKDVCWPCSKYQQLSFNN